MLLLYNVSTIMKPAYQSMHASLTNKLLASIDCRGTCTATQVAVQGAVTSVLISFSNQHIYQPRHESE